MPELDYELMLLGIVNAIRTRAPKPGHAPGSKSKGNLVRNVKYIAYKDGPIWGKLTIDVPYAQFVDYGHLIYPNSRLLNKDYLFVENGLRAELKNIVAKYGGGYVK